MKHKIIQLHSISYDQSKRGLKDYKCIYGNYKLKTSRNNYGEFEATKNHKRFIHYISIHKRLFH